MESKNYKLPLSELLGILKANGYEVSIERILEIQSALLSTPVSKLDLSELKFIIAPVLARNEEDQNNIYKIIDSYVKNKTQPAPKNISGIRAWFTKKRLVFGLKIAGLVLIVLTAALAYFLQKRETHKSFVSHSEQFLPADSLPKRIKTNPVKDTSISRPKSTKSTPLINGKVEYGGNPIAPVRLNIILQMAGAFGLGLGGILYYFIFFERRKRMETEKKAKEEDESFATAKEENKGITEQQVSVVLQIPGKDFLVQKTKEFPVIRSNLKRTASSGKMNLDVRESVLATTKSAGFPSLVFDNQSGERRYLILIDNKQPDAHISYLFNFVINFLSSSKIRLTKYYYTGDIRILHNISGETTTLEDLSYDFPDYHLIIMGDCRSFFIDDTLPQKDTEALFQKWASRSIITSRPLQDWSDPEEQMQNCSFSIVPAEIGAVELLTKTIIEETVIKQTVLANRVNDKYSVAKYDFKTAVEVREYLNNEELFQVVCSLAVYPKLNWNITLALFAAILKKNPAYTIKPDYDTLLKLSRIPWLNADRLEDSFRLQLFNFLKPETEVIARETIIELLKEIDPFVHKESSAYKELQVQLRINSFFLYAHDQQQYKQYAGVKNEFLGYWNDLNEWALKERTRNGLMRVNSEGRHETVEEFVFKEQLFEKQNVTFLRIALLLLPAAILYILFSVFRPSFAYLDAYEKVSFITAIKKDSSCKKEITQIIVAKLDRFDTIPLKKHSDIDYIQINNTEYDRSVNLYFTFTDNTHFDLPVKATDSTATVSIECR